MVSGKCGCKRGLCPISFGLALALTCAIVVLLMPVAYMLGLMPQPPGEPHMVWWGMAMMRHVLAALVKGFVLGVIFACLYDYFSHCMSRCCRKEGDVKECGCNCGCSCCSDKKTITPPL